MARRQAMRENMESEAWLRIKPEERAFADKYTPEVRQEKYDAFGEEGKRLLVQNGTTDAFNTARVLIGLPVIQEDLKDIKERLRNKYLDEFAFKMLENDEAEFMAKLVELNRLKRNVGDMKTISDNAKQTLFSHEGSQGERDKLKALQVAAKINYREAHGLYAEAAAILGVQLDAPHPSAGVVPRTASLRVSI